MTKQNIITKSPDRMITSGKPLSMLPQSPRKNSIISHKRGFKADPIGASILERENDGSKVNVLIKNAKCT